MELQDPTASRRLPVDLLERPAAETARLLANHHLVAARAARRRLGSPEDSEALHDLRVAIRRLRSVLQDWRRQTRDTLPGRYPRDLRQLTRATSPNRDCEVRLEMVRESAAFLPAMAAPGLGWLASHLAGRRHEATREATAAMARATPMLEGDLGERLLRYRVELDVTTFRSQPGTREVLAGLIEESADRVERRLAAVASAGDEVPAHRARIAAKRLRYLLEPFRAEVPAFRDVVAVLVRLQDALGTHRDATGLAAYLEGLLRGGAEPAGPVADERSGLERLRLRLKDTAAAAFEEARDLWIGETIPAALCQARTIAGELSRSRSDREIERKYLLHGLPSLPAGAVAVDVQQGYLPGGRIRERVRRSMRDGVVTCWRSLKAGTGISRVEVEEEIDEGLFDRLWALTEGSRVYKRRYLVASDTLTWEVDEFLDRNLVLAEVELPAEDTAVQLPEWLLPWLEREVTGEVSYLNSTLAR